MHSHKSYNKNQATFGLSNQGDIILWPRVFPLSIGLGHNMAILLFKAHAFLKYASK
jgi:hypothetical protein